VPRFSIEESPAAKLPEVIRVYTPVCSSNPGSMRVLEKAGYAREAVLRRSGIAEGTAIDRVVYAITRGH
jgi:[ribosomal protein S5]-alanine N-acetyltransferase